VVQSGIQALIWAGDADWICNLFAGLASAEYLMYSDSAAFKKKGVGNYIVNSVPTGTLETEGDLSWLRLFGAGHEVCAI
jgi:carboxypeptidase D